MKQRYDFISDGFDGRLKKVVLNKKVGLIDWFNAFEEVLPPIYDSISSEYIWKKYSENYYCYIVVKDGMSGLYDENAKEILPCIYKQILVKKSGIVCAYNAQGLIEIYDSLEKIILKGKYNEMETLGDGGYVRTSKNGLYGVLDNKANIAIPFEYEDIMMEHKDGLFIAKKNNLWGVVDKKNNIILPFEFKLIQFSHDFIYTMKNINGKKEHAFYKRDGELISKYSKNITVQQIFKSGTAICYNGQKYGVIDINGNTILDTKYFEISEVPYCDKELFAVKYDLLKSVAIFDSNGRNITGYNCDTRYNICVYNDYITFIKNGKCGAVDFDGNVIIPFKYDGIDPFDKNGYAVVWKDDVEKAGLVNRKGELVLDIIYDEIIHTTHKSAQVVYDGCCGIAYYK